MLLAVGVGHPEKSLSDVRRADARSAEIESCAGVTRSFQVRLYSVEPSKPILACNLLANNGFRLALLDKPMEVGPKVPLVINPSAFASLGERLAWAASRPDRSVIRPSGQTQSIRPDANSCEEMYLCVIAQFIRGDILNRTCVHDARRNMPGVNQVAQPLRCERIDFVVEGRHSSVPSVAETATLFPHLGQNFTPFSSGPSSMNWN